MLINIGEKVFCDIQTSLFTNENEYGLAVLGHEKLTNKYWIVDIKEDKISYKSINSDLIKFKNDYEINSITTNKNNSVRRKLNDYLQALSFIEYEFIAEDSIVNLKALLYDEKIEFFDDVKDKFDIQLKEYDKEVNQKPIINAVMIAIDKCKENNTRMLPGFSHVVF